MARKARDPRFALTDPEGNGVELKGPVGGEAAAVRLRAEMRVPERRLYFRPKPSSRSNPICAIQIGAISSTSGCD